MGRDKVTAKLWGDEPHMIVTNGKYYVYRHINAASGRPFYIGVGQKEGSNRKKHTSEYRRAFARFTRNQYWKRVYEKYGYEVEILVESDSREFIQQKEKEFIALYGMVTNGGILTNMTEGGDYYAATVKRGGRNNMPMERRIAIGKSTIKRNGCEKAVWVYRKQDCRLVAQYKSVQAASLGTGVCQAAISGGALRHKYVKDFAFSFTDLPSEASFSIYKEQTNYQKRPVVQIDPVTKRKVCEYPNATLAAKSVGALTSNLLTSIDKKSKCGGYYWKNPGDNQPISFAKRNRYQPILKTDIDTGAVLEKFGTIKEAATSLGYAHAGFLRKRISEDGVVKGFLFKKEY